jgi:hypothetical protein
MNVRRAGSTIVDLMAAKLDQLQEDLADGHEEIRYEAGPTSPIDAASSWMSHRNPGHRRGIGFGGRLCEFWFEPRVMKGIRHGGPVERRNPWDRRRRQDMAGK